jgi:hypothetical protein
MPEELKIVNGPSYRGFMFHGPVVTNLGFSVDLTLQSKEGSKEKLQVTIWVVAGRIAMDTRLPEHVVKEYESNDGDGEVQERGFVATYTTSATWIGSGVKRKLVCPRFFLVGSYDTKTRKGSCLKMTAKEFFKSHAREAIQMLMGPE